MPFVGVPPIVNKFYNFFVPKSQNPDFFMGSISLFLVLDLDISAEFLL